MPPLPEWCRRLDSGAFEVRVRIYDPVTGALSQPRRRVKTLAEARAVHRELLNSQFTNGVARRRSMTISEAVEGYAESRHRARPTTLTGSAYQLAPLVERHGQLPIQQLTRKHIDDLLRDLMKGGTIPPSSGRQDTAQARLTQLEAEHAAALARHERIAGDRKGRALTEAEQRGVARRETAMERRTNRIIELRSQLSAPAAARKPWAPRSIKKTLEEISKACRYAMSLGVLTRDPTVGITPPQLRAPVHNTYDELELAAVLAAADADDLTGHVWHLALHGLRRGEQSGARWEHVNFEARTIEVVETRVQAGSKTVLGETKTHKSTRTLPLSDHLLSVLRNAKKRQDERATALGESYDPRGYLAADEAGRPYAPGTLNRRWRRVTNAAGVKPIKLHEARHTAGTLMHLKGVPLAVIAAWLGHANASITGAIYAHSQDDALASAADLLGELGRER